LKRPPALPPALFMARNRPPRRSKLVFFVALVEQAGDEVLFEQADVFGEEGNEHLEDEVLGERPRDAALMSLLKHLASLAAATRVTATCSLSNTGWGGREEKCERPWSVVDWSL